MANAPEMSTDFARWYADTFMDEGATRAMRWKGVVDVAGKTGCEMVEVLVRLAFPSGVPASGTKNEGLGETYRTVVATISGGDSAFDPVRSARELQVLAAAALVQLFSRSSDAAIAVTTASFGGSRKPDLPMNLAGMAEKALVALSGRKHARIEAKALQSTAPKVGFTVSPEAMQSMDPALWKGELERLREAAAAAINTVVTGQNRVISLLHRQITLDEEELQMLWWLIGGCNRPSGRAFADITLPLRPLILGQELGEMTMISPGPASIGAMFLRAGITTDEVTVQAAVNSVDIAWAQEASDSKQVSPVTTPLHFALEKRAELGSTDTWQAGWTGLTGLAADLPMPAVRLAELFYREFLYLYVGE
ncbi:GTPase-associated system all-helical protein GASH [Mesorhizobium sp. ANAO-SY3R2]|uniref:GTPase-associated system all-helical protein GASH n=1 Tax=Mesorhizobium sp. ANAO-SY3R2 TaxID=3166644 RepID=UPI00367237D1